MPSLAYAQAMLKISCGIVSAIVLIEASAIASSRGWSLNTNRAQAHAILLQCCALNVCICRRDSAEIAYIRGALQITSVAHDHAVLANF